MALVAMGWCFAHSSQEQPVGQCQHSPCLGVSPAEQDQTPVQGCPMVLSAVEPGWWEDVDD